MQVFDEKGDNWPQPSGVGELQAGILTFIAAALSVQTVLQRLRLHGIS